MEFREKREPQLRLPRLKIPDATGAQDGETFFIVIFSGAHSGVDTHVPFPNTVVKDPSGDGTANLTVGE